MFSSSRNKRSPELAQLPSHFPFHLRRDPAASMAKTMPPEKAPATAQAQKPSPEPEKPAPQKKSFARRHGLKFATVAAVALFIYDQRDSIQPDEVRALCRRLMWVCSYYAEEITGTLLAGAALGGIAKRLFSRAARNSPNDTENNPTCTHDESRN
ncbi:Uncharacterised protein [Candidatus Anstonella stagnisolia]|nr:Uncharacterised protein [Candidatus Anstonella stagnisolia]